jgi:UDP-N-acetylglucosamine 2-epimerase (non-hydrolysing)
LAAFYNKIPVAHVEAGLRTMDINSPWPEEANRRLTTTLSSIHFAPTETAKNNLLNEGVLERSVVVTGNTVIDTLLEISKKIDGDHRLKNNLDGFFSFLKEDNKVVLITGHRRENFGFKFENICKAIKLLATKYKKIEFVYPVHLNPTVRKQVYGYLSGIPNVHLIDPLNYLEFVYIMKRSCLIMTDSGGIQEEAPSLGIPVVVLRDTTERPEGVIARTAILAGTEINNIVNVVSKLLEGSHISSKVEFNPYGDGKASAKILEYLLGRRR